MWASLTVEPELFEFWTSLQNCVPTHSPLPALSWLHFPSSLPPAPDPSCSTSRFAQPSSPQCPPQGPQSEPGQDL